MFHSLQHSLSAPAHSQWVNGAYQSTDPGAKKESPGQDTDPSEKGGESGKRFLLGGGRCETKFRPDSGGDAKDDENAEYKGKTPGESDCGQQIHASYLGLTPEIPSHKSQRQENKCDEQSRQGSRFIIQGHYCEPCDRNHREENPYRSVRENRRNSPIAFPNHNDATKKEHKESRQSQEHCQQC